MKILNKIFLEVLDYLDTLEKELLIFIFLKHNTIIKYAQYKKIAYSTAVNRKSRLCKKINIYINKLS